MDLIDWHRPPPRLHLSPANQYSAGFVSGALTEVPDDSGSNINFPWKVTIGVNGGGNAAFSVGPGSVLAVSATGDGIATPHDVLVAEYSIYAKVSITSTSGSNNYRAIVATALVGTDEEEFAPDVGVVVPFEFTVKWDDPLTKNAGYFYVKIADIHGESVAGKIVVTELIQVLDQNISSFVIAGDEVVILVDN